jgi:predicted RecB family nuclease
MKHLISEMAKQAEDYANEENERYGADFESKFRQKFAELIIARERKEFAKYCENEVDTKPLTADDARKLRKESAIVKEILNEVRVAATNNVAQKSIIFYSECEDGEIDDVLLSLWQLGYSAGYCRNTRVFEVDWELK